MKTLALYFAVTAHLVAAQPSEDYVQTAELSAYVSHFLRYHDTRRAEALELVPIVVEVANEYDFDPLLVGVVITFESSWTSGITARTRHRERGLMQVHGRAAKGADLSTPRGQILAGVKWLDFCRQKCGDNRVKVLSAYQTGRCGHIASAKQRLAAYKKAVEKFRKSNEAL